MRGTYFPVVFADNTARLVEVTYSPQKAKPGTKEISPGVFVSRNIHTVFDFSLPRGSYTVDVSFDISGESLDLAFLNASRRKNGTFSADVNSDLSLSTILHADLKRTVSPPNAFIYG